MASGGKWHLISYDIRDEKRLRRGAKLLEGRGERLQYSVFRCWLTPTQCQALRHELTEVLTPEDVVLIIPVCRRCVDQIETIHNNAEQADWKTKPPALRIV